MSIRKPADLSTALAAFEAELSAYEVPKHRSEAKSAQSRPAGPPGVVTGAAQPSVPKKPKTNSSSSAVSFSAPPVFKIRKELPPEQPSPEPEPHRMHQYSTTYSNDMQTKYNEAQTKAMQFRTDSVQHSYGKATRTATVVRKAAGKTWEDPTLADWPANDYRLFCGDLGNEVNDDLLSSVFSKYPSFAKAKVCRHKRTGKTKGYGFVSFMDVNDFMAAFKEINGKYVGNRPIKLRNSTWKERNAN